MYRQFELEGKLARMGTATEVSGGHSVQISDSDIDNIVTLYRLRLASGRPADVTWYMCYTGRPNDS